MSFHEKASFNSYGIICILQSPQVPLQGTFALFSDDIRSLLHFRKRLMMVEVIA